jgi:hypothetical protein
MPAGNPPPGLGPVLKVEIKLKKNMRNPRIVQIKPGIVMIQPTVVSGLCIEGSAAIFT